MVYGGSQRIAPRIFDVGTKLFWVVIFTPRSFYLRGKWLRYPLNFLCETQSQSGRFGEDINLLLLPGIERRFLDCPVRSLVTVPSELSLRIFMKNNAFFIFILSCSAKLYRGTIQRIILCTELQWNSDSENSVGCLDTAARFDLSKTLGYKLQALPWTIFLFFYL